jgi:hypothetical protein
VPYPEEVPGEAVNSQKTAGIVLVLVLFVCNRLFFNIYCGAKTFSSQPLPLWRGTESKRKFVYSWQKNRDCHEYTNKDYGASPIAVRLRLFKASLHR